MSHNVNVCFGDVVTWLLPIKNGMPYLPETLASIEAQSYKKWRILAWDNGSTDGSLEELMRWIPSRLPGKVVADRPLGLGASLREMVAECETEFCARIDSDDVNVPERLEHQMAFLEEHPEVALVGTQMNRIDGDGLNHGPFHPLPLEHDDILHFMLYANGISHPTVLFRRSAVLKVGNYRDVGEVNVEDYDLWLRLLAVHKVANLPQCLLNYRVHPKSTTQIAIARNSLDDAMNERFYEHSLQTFGVKKDDARLLRQRCHPNTSRIAKSIARYLHNDYLAGSSSYATSDLRMKSSSFINAVEHFLPHNDVKGMLWMAWQKNGLGIIKKMLKQFYRSLS